MAEILVKVENLYKHYPIRRPNTMTKHDQVKAVDGVSFYIKRGETLGLVGESGCGKSTTRKLVLNLEEPTSGKVLFMDENIFDYSKEKLSEFRKKSQVIYQDPYSSLNPAWKIGSIVGEGFNVHKIGTPPERRERILDLMEKVGLRKEYYDRFPHEFSGGQRQRIGIARALSLNPEFIVADEPVSALDVSIQAQVLNLLKDLQEEFGLTYLFISHDLSVVKHLCDRIAVMYLGKIVEMSTVKQLYSNPSHPYTKMLLKAIPLPDPSKKLELTALEGEVPSPINPPSGCRFHTRCPYVMEKCKKEIPPMIDVGESHMAACYLYE